MEENVKKKTRIYKCYICPTRSSNGLFSFPKKPEIRQEWLNACQKTVARPIDKICYEHFHSSCFVQNSGSAKSHYRLYPDSIPTLKLPSEKEKVDYVSSDHSYATNHEKLGQKVKKLVAIRTKKLEKCQKSFKIQLRLATKTIISLNSEITKLKKLISSKSYKEDVCYEMLKGKFSTGQLDILVKVSTQWGLRHSQYRFHCLYDKKG